MLSHKVLTRKDISAAAGYYEDGADDYYAKELGATQWQGKGADALGLEGEVNSERLQELMVGKIDAHQPSSRSSTRLDSKSRIGIDLTFSAPKSVSIQALVGQDPNLVKAHDVAVARAIEVAETMALARSKVDGKSTLERTGNLIVAKFRHETSREQDPQLHTHAVVLNLTQREDGQWRALKNDEIIKATKYLGATYRAELAYELQKLGYKLQMGRDGMFELEGFDEKQLEAFSKRSAQVEAELEKKGLDRTNATTGEKQSATLRSRAKKQEIDRAALHKDWKQRAASLNMDLGGPQKDHGNPSSGSSGAAEGEQESASAILAVRFAISHLTERQAAVPEGELVTAALKHAVGSARQVDVVRALKAMSEQGLLIKEDPRYTLPEDITGTPRTAKEWRRWLVTEKGLTPAKARQRVMQAISRGSLRLAEARYTTQTALQWEREILVTEQRGRDTVAPLLDEARQIARLEGVSLSQGQRQAVSLIWGTKNRIVGVQGFAGTGKSHMLKYAVEGIAEADHQVRALAPYGTQVRALRELGVQANTVASFLKAKDKGIDEKTVLVIDEAGVVPGRQMAELMKVATAAGARVVLMGDTAQTKAVEAGKPFEQLISHGMSMATMSDIQRQKDPVLRKAVEFAAAGKMKEALSNIQKVTEIADPTARRKSLIEDYFQKPPKERENSLIISGTNEARRELNAMVRDRLGLEGTGKQLDTLIRRDTTQEERRFAKYFRMGDIIQPERDYRGSGLVKGELYEVTATGPGNSLQLRDREGNAVQINPKTHRKLSVYEPDRGEFSPGDSVKITRNNDALDLANGDRFKVLAVTDKAITLANDSRVVKLPTSEPLHMQHAYAVTIHSSQGLTADHVYAEFETNSRTSAKDTFYVAISRERFELNVYTDNAAKLPDAVSKEPVKLSALDLSTRWRDLMRERTGPATPGMQAQSSQRTERQAGQQEKQTDRAQPELGA
jgi:conjugative relaxase-like TrwC/TraI family protein